MYTYDEAHPEGGRGYVETDEPNFSGSHYSKTKAWAEKVSGDLIREERGIGD